VIATDEQIIAMTRAFNNASERLPVLWQLAQEWDRLLSLLEDLESDQDAIQLELQRVAGDIRAKGHGLAIVLQGLGRLADWQRAEGQRLMAKARANEAHAERLKTYALSCMQALGIERLETGAHTLSVRLNPPAVQVVDETAVPNEFVRTVITTSVDKRAVLTHVKQTGEIPAGVTIERGERLEIR
jgi:hypothetical protein